jgi:DNA-binding XRE family transcriptional regulator
MTKPQTITTPSGEELVVLSRGDYDALVRAAEEAREDAADAAVFDARMAELQAGRDARLPAEVSASMLRGLTLIKALRKWRGLKQREVAQRSGIAQGFLSDIESGRRVGSRETLEKIAQALEAPLAWLS